MKTIIFDLDGTLVLLSPTVTALADMDMLKQLRARYTFALVSGSTRQEIDTALQVTGCADLFDPSLVVSKEDTEGTKASGEPFAKIQERIQPPYIMIGDSDADETGTRVVGMPFMRVPQATTLEGQREMFSNTLARAVQELESFAL